MSMYFVSIVWLARTCAASILESLPDFPDGTLLYTQYTPTTDELEPLEPIRWIPRVENRELPELDFRKIEEYQTAVDSLNVLYSPSAIMAGEWVPVNTTSVMHMNQILANRLDTVVMISENNPFDMNTPAVVKYQVDLSSSLIHPLITEYVIMKFINDNSRHLNSPIIPKVFFVSPSVRLVDRRTLKTEFRMKQSPRVSCLATGRCPVRYMVMERGGMSLESLISFCPNHRLPLIDGMRILRQLFVALKHIHSLGIIHGDIHRGNIVRSLKDKSSVLLIDFGRSKIYNPQNPYPETPVRPKEQVATKQFFSHWKLQGYMPSFRDDMFGALYAVAIQTGGRNFGKYMDDAESQGAREWLIKFFQNEDLFYNPFSRVHTTVYANHLEEEDRAIVQETLNVIQWEIGSMTSVNDFPKHDLLIGYVDTILSIL